MAAVKPLRAKGLLRWSDKFSTGPLPVTMAWTKNPNMANIACKQHTLSVKHPDMAHCMLLMHKQDLSAMQQCESVLVVCIVVVILVEHGI